ncbi:invasion associated locus B family protein [Microvirga sp. TS319]|uniref:invasion associated locus B family protein n=1 Tax=Microvirga sp. TS319 TaxID=3241165 RepID=UPI003519F2B8
MSFATRIASLGGSCGLAIAAALLASAPASAQAPKPAAQPAKPAAPAPAQAQQQASGPTVVQVKAEPSQPEWTKVCGKDQNTNTEICYTTRDFVSDQGQPVLALAVYDVKGPQPQKVVRFVMPLGLLLQPGLRFAVDQGQATPGRYVMCLPNGCFAEAQVKDDFIASLKKGANLNVSVQNQVGREITFAVPAAGFGKAFDGPPIDPKVLEEQQKKLQEELQKKSEEMRQKMLQSNGAAAPGAQPAAPATPAPKP